MEKGNAEAEEVAPLCLSAAGELVRSRDDP